MHENKKSTKGNFFSLDACSRPMCGIANFSPFFTMPENMKGSKSEKLEVEKARSRKARRKELEVGEL